MDEHLEDAMKTIKEEAAAKKAKRTKYSENKKSATKELPPVDVSAEPSEMISFVNSVQTFSPVRRSSLHLRLSTDDDDDDDASTSSKRNSSAKFNKRLQNLVSSTKETTGLTKSTRISNQQNESAQPKRSLRSIDNIPTTKIDNQSSVLHPVKRKAQLDTLFEAREQNPETLANSDFNSKEMDSQGHLRLPTPQQFDHNRSPKKGRMATLTLPVVSPKSSKELFSTYSTPTVKDRVKTFESIIKSANKQASYKKDSKPVVEEKSRKSRDIKSPPTAKTILPKCLSQARRSLRFHKSVARNNLLVSGCSSAQKEEDIAINDTDDEWEDCETPYIKSGPLFLKQHRKKAVCVYDPISDRSKMFSGSSDKQQTASRLASSNTPGHASRKMAPSFRFGTPKEKVESLDKDGSAKKTSALLEKARKLEEKELAVLMKKKQILKQQIEAKKLKNEQKRQMVTTKREQQLKEHQRCMEHKLAQSVEKKQIAEQNRMKKYQEKMLQQKEMQKEKNKLEALKLNEILQQNLQINKQNISSVGNASSSLSCEDGPVLVKIQSLNDSSTASSVPASNSKANMYVRSELPAEKLKNPQNYDIADFKSDDDTDDESAPRKKIPAWAQGYLLRKAVVTQLRNPSAANKIFSPITTCDLLEIFVVERQDF